MSMDEGHLSSGPNPFMASMFFNLIYLLERERAGGGVEEEILKQTPS